MQNVDLNRFDNDEYQPGHSHIKLLWFITNALFFNTFLPFPSLLKVKILKLFGAKVGAAVVIKPSVNIKYPWLLEIGNHSWIGECVWIDNLAKVVIGNHVTLSQGAYLLTGNHDYKKVTFDLMVGEITLEDGVWIGAKAIVCPGVRCNSHSILAVGAIAIKDLDAFTIYQGNPAQAKRKRVIS